jgi:hypothetical protein
VPVISQPPSGSGTWSPGGAAPGCSEMGTSLASPTNAFSVTSLVATPCFALTRWSPGDTRVTSEPATTTNGPPSIEISLSRGITRTVSVASCTSSARSNSLISRTRCASAAGSVR